ncbi:MAG: TonB-dependent receptor [Caulobacterales bacterium]|nr:TonB-dependent receptor [Caulobacterales bacterium]
MKARHVKTFLLATGSLAALSSGLAAPAAAQEEEAPVGADRIVVTAQKREQNVQDVPLAVSVYSADLLQNSGIRNFQDLQVIAPGLNVTSTSNQFVTTPRIRGVGTVGDNPGLESSVGIVIDGVPRPRPGAGFNDLGEIERIEVLRGPQGTLFGKNTSAGIINVITRRPEYEFGVNGEASYLFGDFEGYGVSGSVTGPIAQDQAAFRLYGAVRDRDGFQEIATGLGPREEDEDADQDFFTLRGQLLLEPIPDLSINISGDYTDRDENCCVGAPLDRDAGTALVNAVGGTLPLPGEEDPFNRVAFANRDSGQLIEDWGIQGQADWDLGFANATGIVSYRDYELNSAQDSDFSDADIFYRPLGGNDFTFENVTAELRFQGQTGMVDWLVGGFFSDEELTRTDALTNGAVYESYVSLLLSAGAGLAPDPTFVVDIANGLGGAFIPGYGTSANPLFPEPIAVGGGLPAGAQGEGDSYLQDSQSFAFFTHNTISLTDAFDITLGLRYTNEEKEAVADFGRPDSPACQVWETVFGEALDFTTPTAGAILAGFGEALGGVAPADVALIASVTCLNANRGIFETIGFDQSRDENEVTGFASASYRFTPDLLGYVSYSRGYKAGGFNLDRFNQAGADAVDFSAILAGEAEYPAQFEPEIVDSFEGGLKTEWFNNALLANLTVFYSDFETYQLNTFNGLSFFVTTLDGAETVGSELELIYLPANIDGLTVQGGVTYAKATYDEFEPTGTSEVDALSGSNFSLAPEWYVTGALSYRRPVTDTLDALFYIDGRWVSEQNTGSDLDPEKIQEAYTLINGRIGIGSQDERWALELWGRNLFDEDYIQVGFDAPLQPDSFNAFLGEPGTYGVTVRSRW